MNTQKEAGLMKDMNSNIKFQLERITVERACQLLRGNRTNRPLSKSHTRFLSKCIKNGEWKVNGDPIRLSPLGELMDGQHRLSAVVDSGVEIETYVAYGVPMDTFDTIDSGMKTRGCSDILALRGEKNCNCLSSVLRIYHTYAPGMRIGSGRLSHQELEKTLDAKPLVRESLALAMHYKHQLKRVGFHCMLAACHAMFAEKSEKDADLFLEKLATGADLAEGSPILALRNALTDNRTSIRKFTQRNAVAMTIKCWNAFRTDQPVKQIHADFKKGAAFPKPE